MLELRNVSTHYGKIQALHDVSVQVKEGEIVTLIGANGAGKTTLLMTLCGEPKPSSGSIWFEGEQIDSLSTARIMRKDIAVVPEGRRIFARLTVEENLLMGPSSSTRPSSAACWIRFSPCSPACTSAWNSAPAPCPAASSRCWPSAAP